MSRTVALCLDEDSQRHPEYVGLEGESFDHQNWLEVFETGACARSSLRGSQGIDEVWVVSCNDLDPINLAASLKHDRPDLPVKLVAVTAGGSLRSRAINASIDEVLELSAFVRLYGEMKRRKCEILPPPLEKQRIDLPDPRIAPVKQLESVPIVERVGLPTEYPDSSVQPSEPVQTATANMLCYDLQKPVAASVVRKGILMSIMSGSGGSGKSTIAVLAALAAAQKGYRTLLLDCDLQFGDIAYLLRNIPSTPIDLLMDDPATRDRVCTQAAPLVVVGAPDRFETSESIGEGVAALIDEIAPHFDVVITNTGSNWSEQHATLLEKSSIVLFLIDQRSSSLRACTHALELCDRCGIASIPFKFALNRCAKNAPFTASDVSRILRNSSVFELRDGGIEVEEFFASGNAFELRERGNALVASIENMMTQLLPPLEVGPNDQSAIPEMKPRKRSRVRLNKRQSKAAL